VENEERSLKELVEKKAKEGAARRRKRSRTSSSSGRRKRDQEIVGTLSSVSLLDIIY
jgi:hypothetical protein